MCVCLKLIFPDLVEGLVLLNIDPNGKGWIDWAATKVRNPVELLTPFIYSINASPPLLCCTSQNW